MMTRIGILALAMLMVASASAEPKNVLFVAVDDLRIEPGCYGASHRKTPNIDRLAQSGLLLEQSYCQQAVCVPSPDCDRLSSVRLLENPSQTWKKAAFSQYPREKFLP